MEVYDWLREHWKAERHRKDWMGVIDWVRTGVWCEGKAGDEGKGRYKLDGKWKRTGRTKGAMSQILSDADVCSDLRRARREEMYVLQKSEAVKVRAVAKTSSHVNRKMNYLSHILEGGLSGSRTSTLFSDSIGTEEIDMDLVSAVSDEYPLTRAPSTRTRVFQWSGSLWG